MDIIMKNCDWVIVLHNGNKLAEGLPKEIQENQQVLEAYFGG
jgi:ABC-type branched-subunit amino acid transport system ATPase component